jgi:hypothetical protein
VSIEWGKAALPYSAYTDHGDPEGYAFPKSIWFGLGVWPLKGDLSHGCGNGIFGISAKESGRRVELARLTRRCRTSTRMYEQPGQTENVKFKTRSRQ